MKTKTVYSVWYRKILKNREANKLEKENAWLNSEEVKRLKIEQENALREAEKRRLEEINAQIRKQRSAVRNEGMQRDARANRDDLDNFYVADKKREQDLTKALYDAESVFDKKKRLKEEKRINKLKAKQTRIEEKERNKALAARAKIEGQAKAVENKIAEEDTQTRINTEIRTINLNRRWEKEEKLALKEREKNKARELELKLNQERAQQKESLKLLQEEYKKQEKLRREEEIAEKKILAKRRKASGWTIWRRIGQRVRIFLKIYSFENLKNTINTYGYSYSISEFAKQSLGILAIVIGISTYSGLKGVYLFSIIALAIISIPFLLYAWFNQMFAGKRFEMVQSYLSNIIPIFMQKPKIRYALSEVRDMAQGQMQDAIGHAIDYIDTVSTDENVMQTALSFIETEFPNSRIRAVHKMLLDIENGNSKDYNAICENMYTDVESWIRRVYSFQKDLKNRRNSLIILCIFSLLLNAIFTSMYGTNEVFIGFTDRTIYQISTTIFIGLTLLTVALIITRLHGSWLIYDASEKDEIDNIRAYGYIHANTPSIKKNDLIFAILIGISGLIMWVFQRNTVIFLLLPLAVVFAMRAKIMWNSKFKRVSKTLMLEFPVWLRNIALNLHEMTVINAIEESTKTCSYCMKKELEKFFKIYNENPTSIRAFNEFLSEYKIEDVQASMKVLFTVQSMSEEETKSQIAMIIGRNQDLLTKTETIQNKDSLGYAEMLGYAPMVLLTMQLLMSMLLMFMHIMNYMSQIMAGMG